MKLLPLLPASALIALGLLLAAGAQDAPPAETAAAPAKPVSVFLVRHAEKAEAAPGERDPELSPAGRERAELLARMLAEACVTHLYASEYRRTQNTLAPLAQRLGLAVQEISARDPAHQVAALEDLPAGSVAVVAGHSNTLPDLAGRLGGELRELTAHPSYGPMLPDDAYDRLVLITLPVGSEGRAQTIELRFGDG